MYNINDPDYQDEYTRMRLCDTFVLWKGKIARLQDIDKFGYVTGYHLVGGFWEAIPTGTKLEEFNYSDFKLGYSQSGNYYVRLPIRRDWRQGLRPNNLRVRKEDKLIQVRLMDWPDLGRELYYPLENRYQKFSSLDDLTKEVRAIGRAATSRSWFFYFSRGKIKMNWRGHHVGNTDKGLRNEFSFLGEELEEEIGNAAPKV